MIRRQIGFATFPLAGRPSRRLKKPMSELVWLFSYGTLRQPEVQRAVFGRVIESCDDALSGFEIGMMTITDPSVIEKSGTDQHPVLRESASGGGVRGSALRIRTADLAAADRYEAAGYVRVTRTLESGRKAFVYVERPIAGEVFSADRVRFLEPDAAMLERLLPVAKRIYADTFAKDYDPEQFDSYCEHTYALDGPMARDFAAPGVQWRIAALDCEPIGYAKLTPLRAPAPHAARGSLELQQIYLLSDWHGTGVADRLMKWALETARSREAPELYLTVVDHNVRAQRFYKRYDFEDVGRCTFRLGDRVDNDQVWRRRMTIPVTWQPE